MILKSKELLKLAKKYHNEYFIVSENYPLDIYIEDLPLEFEGHTSVFNAEMYNKFFETDETLKDDYQCLIIHLDEETHIVSPFPIRSSIGKQIKNLRIEKGYSLRQLAKLSGIPYSNLSYYENGERNFGVDVLAKILSCLGAEVRVVKK